MTAMGNLPEVVSREEWLAARKQLLAKEKELTRARDRVNADRRRLPMVRVDKPYTFEGPNGTVGPARPVRGPAATGDAPLHVRPGMGRGLPELLLGRRRDRQAAAAARAQHHARRGVAGAVREARRLPRADGLDVPLVLLLRQRLQLRLPRHPRRPGRAGAAALPHRGRARRGRHAWTGGRGPRTCAARRCRASARSCGSTTRSSTPTPPSAAASRSSTTATPTSTSPPSAARRRGRNRRAARTPLGLQVGGPAMRLPDEYDT